MKKEVITSAEYQQRIKKRKGLKFGNRLVQTSDGFFASEWEYERWGALKLLQRAGQIKNLTRQVVYRLVVNKVEITKYIADFVYLDLSGSLQYPYGKLVVEDTKSEATEKLSDFQIKKKLMKALFDIDIKISKRIKTKK